ncbi:hypothetical protein GCM10027511_12910 [Hymenobacter humi]
MPAAAGGVHHHGIARDQRQAQVVAHKLFTAALEADFYDVEAGKGVRYCYVLQPIENIEAVAASGAASSIGFAAARFGAAAPSGRT